MITVSKTLSTFSALVFRRMNSHVQIQVLRSCKTFLTQSTWKWLISNVSAFMIVQIRFGTIAFAADSTYKALFSCVRCYVDIQVLSRSKPFVTDRTHKRFLSRVTSFMNIQIGFGCKAFVAHCTQMRSWLVVMWTLSDISFNLDFKATFTCLTRTQ